MAEQAKSLLRELPSVDRLLNHASSAKLLNRYRREYVLEKCRAVLDEVREEIRQGKSSSPDTIKEESLISRVEQRVCGESALRLVRVVNATGTILHTNLGRALLPQQAIDAACIAGMSPVNLEYDLAKGGRGRREENIEELLVQLTGAEAATVVNNNAAAVLLALNTVADRKEVIVSRGELIEIGGSFRIPEIMAKSGATLREVGSTNRTHPEDYEKAINDNTALLLKVHTSNYKIVGFSSEVGLERLVAIGKRHNLPVMEDLGSGALIDLSKYGLPKEPIAEERIQAGASIVTFSGDKILGGPQAGLLLGDNRWIGQMKKNHLHRALRCGKLTLAALEATLRLYRQAPDVTAAIPTLKTFTRPLPDIEALGDRILPKLRVALGDGYTIDLEHSTSQIGSGALPAEELPTIVIAVSHRSLRPDRIAERFRRANPPIIGRIKENRFLLDLRTIFDPEDLIPNFKDDDGREHVAGRKEQETPSATKRKTRNQEKGSGLR